MKIFKKIVILLIIVLIGIQFVPTKLNQSTEVSESDLLVLYNAPQNVQSLFKTSCYDCHSDNTHYPWYSKIQPVAWFMENHIKDGKKELNFSEWSAYSNRRKKGKLKSIINQIKEDEMPLSSYTLIHQDAKITKKEKQAITNWLITLRDNL